MAAPLRVGINGFGRIGRCTLKHLFARGATVAGINDLADLGDPPTSSSTTPCTAGGTARSRTPPALKGILRVADEALVSCDILGDTHSAIVDGESTMVLRNRVAKVLVWYDNEWGYSARLADFAQFLVARGV